MKYYDEVSVRLDNVNVDRLIKYSTSIGATKFKRKQEIIESIAQVYNSDTFVEDNYNLLNDYEKELEDYL
jgi:hypothetical protein